MFVGVVRNLRQLVIARLIEVGINWTFLPPYCMSSSLFSSVSRLSQISTFFLSKKESLVQLSGPRYKHIAFIFISVSIQKFFTFLAKLFFIIFAFIFMQHTHK